ncbi:aminoglycoside 3-N-acetyltransferase [Crossiella equi]|uniref:Aminoglycoside N(3)-acetyltransferase n=1 Tax=Crossiella equi TaxID=130796 RepID=A0ABS5AS55_9PSEU|nr:AAC(3) family N-acetyltransferase [Crossiella equi]MBP2479396.1 aminoglycoside 3-N-acetyltransferase [Crossiella equi]
MLDVEDLVSGWRALGLLAGDAVIVHASLSALGPVRGGAPTVVESLVRTVGVTGTVVAPTFTPQIADPDPDHVGVPSEEVRARRGAVPLFERTTPSRMGAIAEALRVRNDAVRSGHPQTSVAAVGRHAADIAAPGSLGFALGKGSPFGRLHDLDGVILLVGVGHNRNSFLHHVETLTPRPRLKLRRFPLVVDGERVWCEVPDVGDDNDTHFPTVGRDFEEHAGVEAGFVGAAECRLLRVRPFVDFAVPRLTRLLDEARGCP